MHRQERLGRYGAIGQMSLYDFGSEPTSNDSQQELRRLVFDRAVESVHPGLTREDRRVLYGTVKAYNGSGIYDHELDSDMSNNFARFAELGLFKIEEDEKGTRYVPDIERIRELGDIGDCPDFRRASQLRRET